MLELPKRKKNHPCYVHPVVVGDAAAGVCRVQCDGAVDDGEVTSLNAAITATRADLQTLLRQEDELLVRKRQRRN